MLWVLLLIGHLIGIVGYTLLLRKSTLGKLDKTLMAALMQTGIFLPSILFLVFGNVSFDHTPMQWFFLTLGGFMLAGLMITNVWALAHLDASLFTILYNLRLLMTTILGFIVLGELPTPLQMVGGLIILVSILMLNLHRDKRWRSKSILVGLFAMLWFSFHAVLEKYNLQQLDFQSYFFTFALIGTILIWLLVLYKRVDVINQIEHIKDKKIYALIATRALSAYAYTYALLYGSLAVTNYVSGMSVALIVLFGIYVLGEKTEVRQKLTAVGVACIGLTLILIGRLIQ
ncbi:MAG: DMT family transporter [Candidatus Saccharimonadales bacterium]